MFLQHLELRFNLPPPSVWNSAFLSGDRPCAGMEENLCHILDSETAEDKPQASHGSCLL